VRDPRAGFTLIELMIVVAIIAVLAAILIPNFLHARAESQAAACEGNERQIATALEEYAVDTGGRYPPSGVVSAALLGPTEPYLSSIPRDPVSLAAYKFVTPSTNARCTVATGTTYEIDDAGGHDGTVQIVNGTLGDKSVIYCSGSGITSSP
jgi:prepilin-type N-terminal cleavage/methylation domain-containing protein